MLIFWPWSEFQYASQRRVREVESCRLCEAMRPSIKANYNNPEEILGHRIKLRVFTEDCMYVATSNGWNSH
jgi:hypothetical protein